MKKFKYVLLILLAILILPFGVFAEGEEENNEAAEENNEVIVYFFRGEGCSHCAEAEAWFKSIEEEYGSKFEIKDYETWYNEDNSKLMTKVAKARGEEETATGVPYIIIGDKSWVGFAEDNKQQIIDKINEMYDTAKSERYDIMSFLANIKEDDEKKSSSSDVVALIIIILVAGGTGAGIYFARKQNA